jgi:hypothetical protein
VDIMSSSLRRCFTIADRPTILLVPATIAHLSGGRCNHRRSRGSPLLLAGAIVAQSRRIRKHTKLRDKSLPCVYSLPRLRLAKRIPRAQALHGLATRARSSPASTEGSERQRHPKAIPNVGRAPQPRGHCRISAVKGAASSAGGERESVFGGVAVAQTGLSSHGGVSRGWVAVILPALRDSVPVCWGRSLDRKPLGDFAARCCASDLIYITKVSKLIGWPKPRLDRTRTGERQYSLFGIVFEGWWRVSDSHGIATMRKVHSI